MKKTNKKSMAIFLSEKYNIDKKESLQIVNDVFDIVFNTLSEFGEVDITNIGKFEIRKRKGRLGINPNTKERVIIQSSNVPSFRASKVLKEKVNINRKKD